MIPRGRGEGHSSVCLTQESSKGTLWRPTVLPLAPPLNQVSLRHPVLRLFHAWHSFCAPYALTVEGSGALFGSKDDANEQSPWITSLKSYMRVFIQSWIKTYLLFSKFIMSFKYIDETILNAEASWKQGNMAFLNYSLAFFCVCSKSYTYYIFS